MSTAVGPTANLPARARRLGRSGSAWQDGRMLGEIISVEWEVAVEQVPVPITGSWGDENKPGGETRTATIRIQDIDDTWALRVWRFLQARRNDDRSSATFPEFDLITKLADIGAPRDTQWQIIGCQLYSYGKSFSTDDGVLVRDIPVTFRDDKPLDAFEYADSGIVVTRG